MWQTVAKGSLVFAKRKPHDDLYSSADAAAIAGPSYPPAPGRSLTHFRSPINQSTDITIGHGALFHTTQLMQES
jgi:hypothetical protein